MNVAEFKALVAEFKKNLKTFEPITGLVARLEEHLNTLENEKELTSTMMTPIKNLINEFWDWVATNLPHKKWQNGDEVDPWLDLQKKLVNVGLLPFDFHHDKLYQVLIKDYEHRPNNQLNITDLMPLLICCSRMLGYAGKNEGDRYPLEALNTKIQFKNVHEIEKLKDIMFLLRSIFYLIYHHCTVKQFTLLPFLIYFRTSSTEEERRSELAIFNSLSQKTAECLNFFHDNSIYTDMRSLQIPALKFVKHLLPQGQKNFMHATQKERWMYLFIHQSRTKSTGTDQDLLQETLHLLEQDFATNKDQSYTAAENFIASIREQTSSLTENEILLLNPAIALFCLDKRLAGYIKQRNDDPRGDKYSFLSLSKETKISAAQKKQLAVHGKSVEFSFFETIALQEGKLKKVVEYEENDGTAEIWVRPEHF